MSVKPNFGGKDLPLVFKGDKLVYPNPVKDGLVLWYDFAGMRNTNLNRDVAKDLSGNENHGTLQNFNFTTESGYDKNKLLFDGVDDKLTIPELALDETGMTVGVDGKVYAYEDDKVVTVRDYSDDGRTELEGTEVGGRNLLKGTAGFSGDWERKDRWSLEPDSINGLLIYSRSSAFVGVSTAFHVTKGQEYTFSFYGKADIDTEVNVYFHDTIINVTNPHNQTVELNDEFKRISVSFVALESTVIKPRVEKTVNNPNKIYVAGYKLEKGTVATPWTPAPEDFQTTSLSPSSLSNLQLYNRPLRKNELLQNTESAGLKELVDGVPVQDGLVLHYDFSQENNTSEYKGKAFDYSGNGNHGELRNFAYTDESGYVGDGLKFDGVDDEVNIQNSPTTNNFTLLLTLKPSQQEDVQFFADFLPSTFYLRKSSGDRLHGSILSGDEGQMTTPFISPLLSQDEIPISVGLMVDNSNNIFHLILNGEIVRSVESYNIQDSRLTALGKWSASDNRFIGDMFSTHFYNRALTPEEIAHNYQIEKERFNIE